MKKFSKIICLIFAAVLLLGMALEVSAAAAPYQTYTYDIDGMPVYSPHAYVPSTSLTSYELNMPHALNSPQDIFVDDRNWTYVSNTKNNTVEVFNEKLIYQFSIGKFVNKQGVQDSLYEPSGLFVFDGKLYVCDTLKARIVKLKKKLLSMISWKLPMQASWVRIPYSVPWLLV